MFETIRIETDTRGVATLTLAREDKHNAMSALMLAELTQAAVDLGADDAVRVVILTGAGKSFCAGGDLGWMRDQRDMDGATRAAEAGKLATMLGALNTLPKPLIGRVQGNAFGGGVGMASVCDVAIGVDSLKMGLTETRLGIIPATIGPYVIARMGEGRARRVFMSGRLFGAAEAVELGLLAKAVPAQDLDAAVEAEVVPYLSCAPGAVAAAKALALELGGAASEEAVAMSIAALSARWETEEAAEGIGAFFDKRKAAWMS
ncbi:crotonase/enoyl-CoA hydratase family protein [Sulfitobacter sp. M57]|uniref:crotonase/enoyl-CoA hydratase family protein n=1 Tax=unclassified Sulfitobacter TaxID=196795 RepID=UPI0023E16908|nr:MULTISPECIES: crotonase/enoyl-CoA hydratase family protein [unclassified Sulfitobacter]MDF3414053.1 crotonase/enoyl-CoA hydratase family protein [Sulfitobacter sp. KE5]MDF3420666.1 crotonase/enoyl-CoA hydratase family protein [Sulfitobacter sp. KE43]MDF3432599.1 crotonase/enoyl-CoA hydratase family protein [Sulfitobacter sp. KE42]MDF3458238.1 crotonase/enoyl-CoA hydratase family protein [Sulfitobacter sp. S74]MDF3462139.1 crotonase/enoyl-CoA hydratase family protein [Sulfitobacter sp. Ks18]